MMTDYIKREDAIKAFENICIPRKATNGIVVLDIDEALSEIELVPSADVRENITAHKVIGGGEHDGATCWFECSRCGKTVDVNDEYCSECGARFEA